MSVHTRGRVYNSAEARERINGKIRKGSSARHSFFTGENTTRAFRMCFYPLISPQSLHIRTATADGYSCVCVVTCHRPVQSQRRADGRPCCWVSVCCAALRCVASFLQPLVFHRQTAHFERRFGSCFALRPSEALCAASPLPVLRTLYSSVSETARCPLGAAVETVHCPAAAADSSCERTD